MILAAAKVMKSISLAQLLSSCMDASLQGCNIIQRYQREREDSRDGGVETVGVGPLKLKEDGNIKSVVTQADIDAQARIVGGLRSTWGDDLLIIGEEDDDPNAAPCYDGNSSGLMKDVLAKCQHYEDDDDEIPIEELALFVDPLDGTREFVEGRLQNVACLVGIARNNRPIAGVIGVPFPDGTASEADPEIYYAMADRPDISGCWTINKNNNSSNEESASSKTYNQNDDDDDQVVTILTGDSTNPVLINATNYVKEIAQNPKHMIVGGTAAKLRLVATGIQDSVAILHFKTELWDTCSAQALLTSKGGKITDLFGSPLVHSPTRPFGNIFGVVASSGGSEKATRVHKELCRRMRANGESVHKIFREWIGQKVPGAPQAIDIARDLEGLPFSLSYLERLLKSENPKGLTLSGYSIPESQAWRGMMSNGVRISLDWNDVNSVEPSCRPTSDIFYKSIVMADLVSEWYRNLSWMVI
jgi:3'-phosphoadenosine 5'-phosphosulfate (PAPS) 3'-phosphatase